MGKAHQFVVVESEISTFPPSPSPFPFFLSFLTVEPPKGMEQ